MASNGVAPDETLLTWLRPRSVVDIDSMDPEVAREYGAFCDCTSNQAIAYNEVQKPKYASFLEQSVSHARSIQSARFKDVTATALAVDVAMVQLQLQMLPYITGRVHVQVNPQFSNDTSKIVENARRLEWLASYFDPHFEKSRMCIKIPATWEGLQACEILESSGTVTLATTLFSKVQMFRAGEVGCHYIAPYVHELRVQTEPGYLSPTPPLLSFCIAASRFYKAVASPTIVVPASLTSIEEILLLAGVAHITIAPKLLTQLATTSAHEAKIPDSLYGLPRPVDGEVEIDGGEETAQFGEDTRFKGELAREGAGEAERKLVQAIDIFSDLQIKLEAMMASHAGADL